MINVSGDHNHLVEPFATETDASSYIPPSSIGDSYLFSFASGCLDDKADHPKTTTNESLIFSHDNESSSSPAQDHVIPCHLFNSITNTFGRTQSRCCEAIASKIGWDENSRLLIPCSCQSEDPTNYKPTEKDKKSSEDKRKKRQAQNRAAQRAFRQRKENKVRDLERRVAELEESTKEKLLENQQQKHQIRDLSIKKQIFRAVLATDGHHGASLFGSMVLSLLEAADNGSKVTQPKGAIGANEKLSGWEERAIRLSRIYDSNGIKKLEEWEKHRLMLSEEKIIRELKQIDGVSDELL